MTRPLRDDGGKRPHGTMLVVPNPYSKTGGNTIVLAIRRYRTLDPLLATLKYPERTRWEHADA